MLALYFHHCLGDFKKAKKLYKEGLRRTEFPIGCYNMLLSIYLHDFTLSTSSSHQGDCQRLRMKINNLDNQFDHFLKHD